MSVVCLTCLSLSNPAAPSIVCLSSLVNKAAGFSDFQFILQFRISDAYLHLNNANFKAAAIVFPYPHLCNDITAKKQAALRPVPDRLLIDRLNDSCHVIDTDRFTRRAAGFLYTCPAEAGVIIS